MQNKFNALSLFIAVIGLFFSYYFYTLSVREKEPVLVQKNNIQIFSRDFIKSNSISLTYTDNGNKITDNLYLQEYLLWNKGNEIIKKEDILRNLNLTYPKNAKIIDAFISESTRPDIVRAESNFNDKTVNFSFSNLEKNDGFKIQILYSSDTKSTPEKNGSIAGVSKILDENDITNDKMLVGIARMLYVILIIIGVALILVAAHKITVKTINFLFPQKAKKILEAFGLSFSVLFVIAIFSILAFNIYHTVHNEAEKAAQSAFPSMINLTEIKSN